MGDAQDALERGRAARSGGVERNPDLMRRRPGPRVSRYRQGFESGARRHCPAAAVELLDDGGGGPAITPADELEIQALAVRKN